jgi:IPT/TIG domain
MPRVRSVIFLVVAVVMLAGGAGCSKKKGLRITGIEPTSGPYLGNSTVTIRGSGFQEGGTKGVKVYFGDREARVLGFVGDDVLKVETPAGEVGRTVDVLLVFDDARSLPYEKAFTYTERPAEFNVDALVEGDKAGKPATGAAAPPPSAPPPQ